jgi:nuclear GTP-binding protein
MESDDLIPKIPRKRSHSPTPSITTNATAKLEVEAPTRAPKRQRRAKDVPAYDAPVDAVSISRGNPMSRKVLKEAKKARRDATRAHRALGGVGGGMDIDGEDGALQFTFMATTEGVSF